MTPGPAAALDPARLRWGWLAAALAALAAAALAGITVGPASLDPREVIGGWSAGG